MQFQPSIPHRSSSSTFFTSRFLCHQTDIHIVSIFTIFVLFLFHLHLLLQGLFVFHPFIKFLLWLLSTTFLELYPFFCQSHQQHPVPLAPSLAHWCLAVNESCPYFFFLVFCFSC